MALCDLILKLLEQEKRLGLCFGAHQIKSHALFTGLNWHAIHIFSRPPFIPSLFPLDDMKAIEGVDIEEYVQEIDTNITIRV